jgi:hypothetical protein
MADEPKEKRKRRSSETRQRRMWVGVRLLDEEHAKLVEKATAAGWSVAAYMRACALGDAGPRAQRSPTIERQLAADSIRALNKAGGNLNQIAHGVNMDIYPAAEEVKAATESVRAAALQILRAFGYKPHDEQG